MDYHKFIKWFNRNSPSLAGCWLDLSLPRKGFNIVWFHFRVKRKLNQCKSNCNYYQKVRVYSYYYFLVTKYLLNTCMRWIIINLLNGLIATLPHLLVAGLIYQCPERVLIIVWFHFWVLSTGRTQVWCWSELLPYLCARHILTLRMCLVKVIVPSRFRKGDIILISVLLRLYWCIHVHMYCDLH